MMLREETTVLIERLLAAMDLTIPVTSIQGDQIFLCKTLHLRELRVIEDELGHEYTVTEVLNNQWIKVEPIGSAPVIFEGAQVICPALTFLYGTPSSTDSEYQQIAVESGNKTPLVWYWWNTDRERFFGTRSNLDREIKPRIVFLDETNESDWTNEDHLNYSLQPMFNLVQLFLETADQNRTFKKVENFETIKRPRFGRYVDPRGNEGLIINEYLSGVELQPTLINYKLTSCANC